MYEIAKLKQTQDCCRSFLLLANPMQNMKVRFILCSSLARSIR